MKREAYWIGLLVSFWTLVVFAPEIFGWRHLDGFASLFVRFFLGYCAIILVAQVLSALKNLRSVAEKLSKQKKVPVQVELGAERPPLSPEE